MLIITENAINNPTGPRISKGWTGETYLHVREQHPNQPINPYR
jgi:hypothetical protein